MRSILVRWLPLPCSSSSVQTLAPVQMTPRVRPKPSRNQAPRVSLILASLAVYEVTERADHGACASPEQEPRAVEAVAACLEPVDVFVDAFDPVLIRLAV